MNKYKQLLNFFYEVGQLKRIPRSGWVQLGISNPESIADHTTRSVFIAFVLAKLEGADPYKTALINAFHEIGETRIGDVNKVGARYLNKKEAEEKALKEQYKNLPKEIADAFKEILYGLETDHNKETLVARDADLVECAIQAKEYIEQGYELAQNWIDNVAKTVKTESAKKIVSMLKDSDSLDWFKNLKKIER
ncbi:HD domain-containing protein [Candidatus Woesearchaeota archaeon]|nr:HD domain-containing protein [Candidatus Woesearchaeota archaeon]